MKPCMTYYRNHLIYLKTNLLKKDLSKSGSACARRQYLINYTNAFVVCGNLFIPNVMHIINVTSDFLLNIFVYGYIAKLTTH